jgi:hypothetical protein
MVYISLKEPNWKGTRACFASNAEKTIQSFEMVFASVAI